MHEKRYCTPTSTTSIEYAGIVCRSFPPCTVTELSTGATAFGCSIVFVACVLLPASVTSFAGPAVIPELAHVLHHSGWSSGDLRGFLGENWLRVMSEIWVEPKRLSEADLQQSSRE